MVGALDFVVLVINGVYSLFERVFYALDMGIVVYGLVAILSSYVFLVKPLLARRGGLK